MKNTFNILFVSLFILFLINIPDAEASPCSKCSGNHSAEYIPYSTTDLIEDIKIEVSKAETDNYQPGAEIGKSIDNDMTTIYHSSWNNSPVNYFPIYLTYHFDSASIDYLIYYPRTSGNNGNFGECDIQILRGNNTEFESFIYHDFKGSSSPSRIDFPATCHDVKSIRFVIWSGAGDNQGFASCSQMEFYKNNPEKFDYTALFTDASCSRLKPGIKLSDINDCKSGFHRNIAEHIYNGTYPEDFRIAEYKAFPHPEIYSKKNKTSQYSLLDNPTGIYVEENEELVLFVEDMHDQKISLRIQNLDRPGGDGFGGSAYFLGNGQNKIRANEKGLVYIIYHTPDYLTARPVRINIASGKVNGYFDNSRHDYSDWEKMLDNTVCDYFDVLGKYTHLTFPVSSYKEYTKCGKELIDTYDKIAALQMEFMGLMKYDKVAPNRIYLNVMYHSYMYASTNHTGYHINTLCQILNNDNLKTGSIWGPAHEIGHVNQTRPGLLWAGMTEVTNNIYSLYVQTSFGNISRIQGESLKNEGSKNRYEKAFNNIMITNKPHGKEKDVFCKLVPFWQLQLYISEVLGMTDFYKDLHEDVRNSPDSNDHGQNQLDFIVRCCRSSKLDLTEFFTQWGFLTEIDEMINDYGDKKLTITKEQILKTKKQIKDLKYKAPNHDFKYICDNNIALYKENKPIKKGTIKIEDNTITLNGWENVAAYEVYENGKLIFISHDPTFKINPSDNSKFEIIAVPVKGKKVTATIR